MRSHGFSAKLLLATGAVVAAFWGCTPFGSDGSGGAPLDAAPSGNDARPMPVDASADTASSPDCPASTGGPALVRAGRVCIDRTPVTVGQYREFRTAAPVFDGRGCGQDFPTDPTDAGSCAVQATTHLPSEEDDIAVTCVTSCDARAFCLWAGKHLCGGLDGNPLDDPDQIAANKDEWTNACSLDGTQDTPTGSTWNSDGCVIKGGALLSPQSVERKPPCEGPPGVFDLIGNVDVWIDACNGTSCRVAGESTFFRSSNSVGLGQGKNQPGRCDAIDSDLANYRATDLGFRCCAKPTKP